MREKPDYAAAVREMGFAPGDVPRVVRLIETQRRDGCYGGFRSVLAFARLSLDVGPAFSSTHVEPVVRRVEAMEATGMVARLHEDRKWAEEDRREREKQRHADDFARSRLLLALTESELAGRVRLDAELAKEWERLFPEKPLIGGHVSTERQREQVEEFRADFEIQRLHGELRARESNDDADEGVDWGRVSAAMAKSRADLLDVLRGRGSGDESPERADGSLEVQGE